MNFKKFLFESEEDYRIAHKAPTKDSGSPFHNVSLQTYPDDFYTLPLMTVSHIYGSHHISDASTAMLIRNAHNKPDARIKIYRAIPKLLNTQEKINEFEKQKAFIMKNGKMPRFPDLNLLDMAKRNLPDLAIKWNNPSMSLKSAYFEILDDEIKKLTEMPQRLEKKIEINPGDWVTPSRIYAVEHGESIHGKGNYRILTKTVEAKDLYTDGDSLQEFGYDP